MQSRSTKLGFVWIALVGLVVMTTVGCGEDSGSQKLDTPEGIDWAAIEAEDSAMAESQELGE